MWRGAYKLFSAISCCLMVAITCPGQQTAKVGAYYFDGWTGTYPTHLTKSLKDSFNEREPKWGWLTSTPAIMRSQLQAASEAGISFFSFCWYFNAPEKYEKEALNNALRLYRKMPDHYGVQYCLLVANHAGFLIGPGNWDIVSRVWLDNFSSASYVRAGGKPLLIFFSVKTLVAEFGAAAAVRKAFENLDGQAKAKGLGGVTFAACVSANSEDIRSADSCGFDVLTGYNYHSAGFTLKQRQIPIDSMQTAERRVWNNITAQSSKPYIPVTTINWDPRPWATKANNYRQAPYYTGFSPNSVSRSLANCVNWLDSNKNKAVPEKIALLYAWNEYGEGAWLTPTKKGVNYLKHVKKIIRGGR